MHKGSDSAFEQWIIQQTGGRLAGYENLLLQWISTCNQSVVPDGVVTIYPEPTIFNDHPILAFTEPAGTLIEAMENDAVQQIAWQRNGFRSGTRVLGLSRTSRCPRPATRDQKKTQAPGYEVTKLLLDCFVSNQC